MIFVPAETVVPGHPIGGTVDASWFPLGWRWPGDEAWLTYCVYVYTQPTPIADSGWR